MARKKSAFCIKKLCFRALSIILLAAVILSGTTILPGSFSGIANAASPISDVFTDDFNDGNADGWTTYGSGDANNRGTWAVNGSGQYTINGCTGAKSVVLDTSFADLVYEADLVVGGLNDDGTGVLFRITDPTGNTTDGYSGYFVGVRRNKTIQLGRVTGGSTWKELAVSTTGCTNGHLKVVAVGNNIKAYLNDVLYIDYTDSDGSQITSAGAIGLRTWWGTSQIDNISVRDYNIQPTAAPQFNIQEGVYNSAQTVQMDCATADAEIRYTTDGSIPDAASALYSTPITVTDSAQIRAKAFVTGGAPSDVSSALYIIAEQGTVFSDDFTDGDKSAWVPAKGLAEGSWIGTQTEENGVYSFTNPRGDKAVTGSGYNDFIMEGDVNPADSVQSSGFSFRVNNSGDGADKLDGYFVGINVKNYVEVCKFQATGNGVWTGMSNYPAVVNKNTNNRLKVIAVGQNFWVYVNGKLVASFSDSSHAEGGIGLRAWNDNGMVSYDNISATKLIPLMEQVKAPVISPAAVVFTDSQTVTISCETPGAEIHYTLDGTAPTSTSPIYAGPITLSATATVKAIATKAGMKDSALQSVTYTKTSANFTDDFEDNNSSGWATYGGTWTEANGAYSVNAGDGYKTVANNTNFTDFTYEADVSISGGTTSDNAGLIFRVSGPTVGADNLKGYYAGIRNGGTVQVGRFNNNWQELASIPYPITSGQAYHLKVVANGSNIDVYVNGTHVVSVVDSMFTSGAVGMRNWKVNAKYDNVSVVNNPPENKPVYDWSWVKGAVFVPTNVVNEIQQWKEYDHEVNDRELSYAHEYGINFVRVYLHNLLWENNSAKLLADFEDFLTLTDKYGIKVEVVFFDDCWDDHPTYDYDPNISPRYGAHNSRWVEAPGDDYKLLYNNADGVVKAKLKAYVEGIVNAHLNDDRIAFWNTYNEPSNGEAGIYDQVTKQLMNDSRIWIKELGSEIPVSATAGQFTGASFSDFLTWHPYEADYPKTFTSAGRTFTANASTLADECMQRNNQSVPGIVQNYGDNGIGFVMWEFGIGRDNCRFPWGSDTNPLNYEPEKPFHGVVYPDGHPWSVEDIKALKGTDFDTLPLFRVQYFNDSTFTALAKNSITPRIDFDLGDETGTGSPDASAGIGKDNFSVRWAGAIKPAATGNYTFYADSDNIAAIYVGGTKVVDKTSNTREEASGNIELTANQQYSVKIEYVHGTGNASLHIKWEGPSLEKTVLLPVLSTASAQAVTLDSDTVSLKVGDSKKLIATISPLDAANQNVSWSSDNEGVVHVDATGNVKALSQGTAEITVTTEDGNFTASCTVTVTKGTAFKNPIVTVSTGAGSADPSVVFRDGYYYYCKVDADKAIQVAKAKRLQDIGTAPRVTVYTPPGGQVYTNELWAPELMYINGKWYIYYTAGAGANHRMYVLEANSQDPQGDYTWKGKMTDSTDKWAIDGTVLQKDDGSLYFVWSGWQGDVDGRQDIYIAPMSNPWTISGGRVLLSSPLNDWERKGGPAYINEGPEILKKDGKIFIVYSASGSWSDDYCLGMLTNTDGDVLNPAAWTKSNGPVFSKAAGAYGPGHNSFTVSPDGTEDWIVYHADKNSGGSWGNRSIRAQKFTWNADGTPSFGTPVAYGASVEQPSGTPEVERYLYEAEDAAAGGTAIVADSGNASGGKIVGHLDNVDSDYVMFKVNVAQAGIYSMTVMADNGSAGGVAEHTLTVNNGAPQIVAYKNYGWGRFNPSSVSVTLNQGLNTIKLAKKTNFAQIDCIALELVEDSSGVPVEAISLDKSTVLVTSGQASSVVASIKPLTGTDKTVTITSTDENIASAVQTGLDIATGTVTVSITGNSVGTAKIRIASATDTNIFAECNVTVRGLPTEPDLAGFTVDQFDGAALDSAWSIFQETSQDWSISQGAITIHTQATDIYQNNNSQNNVFLRSVPASGDFEIVTKVTAPITANHQQAGLFVWQDADNLIKLAHVYVDGKTFETAYEINQKYQKAGNFAAHPGGDTVTLKIRKLGNSYTTYYWDGYNWIQAADSVTANLSNIKIGFFANNIVAADKRINAVFDYFAVREISGGVDLDKNTQTIQKGATVQLTNQGASGTDVVWSSSNGYVATVDQNGLVTAVNAGRAIITVKSKDGAFTDTCLVTVADSTAQPEVLFSDDFSDNTATGWTTYDGTWQEANGEYTVNSGAGYKAVYNGNFTDYVMEADVQIASGNEAGMIFRATDPQVGPDAFNGYYVGINAASKSAVLGMMRNGSWTEIASRKMAISTGAWYHIKVIADGNHIQVYINDNALNTNAYPKFDLLESSYPGTGKIGLRTFNAAAKFDNVKISSYKAKDLGETYTNSVVSNTADPFVLKYNGTYYLYGTNTELSDTNKSLGIKVYTSTDLVNWTDKGLALKNEDSWGAKNFWAPEVVERNGTFYMYYAVEERLAVATSKSPLGPFVQEVQEPIEPNTVKIDAHVFKDDDGKQYLYFVRFNNCNEIWVAELNDDMKTIKPETMTFCFRPTQAWEKSQKPPVADINEGPFVIKHNGTYYLTYSGNHFESPDYGVGYATSSSPMGPWTKYEYNPIMKSNLVVPGAGHHSLVYSPDNTELFMVYHTHYNTSSTEPRKLAIDRVHFVPQASGPDAMEVWGPTITPQPMPSNVKAPSGGDTNSGNGGSTTTVTTPAAVTATVEVKPVLSGTTANAAVSGADIQKALAAAKADSDGSKTVTLKVAEVKGADRYTIEVPKATVTSGGNSNLKLESPVGTVVVPGDMFDSKEITGDKVQLTIGLADGAAIKDQAVKQAVGNRPVIELYAAVDGKTVAWNNPEAPVKVAVAYKPAAEELKKAEHITVWSIDESGKAEAVPSARYNAETGEVTFTTNLLSNFAVVYVDKTFSDTGKYKWAENAIEVMASKGVINGTSNTTYSPANNITRGDFMVLLVKALGLNAKAEGNFDDVAEGSYYYNAVAIAKELGITTGVGDNRFDPKANISRQDMLVLAEKAMRVADKALLSGSGADIAGYSDATQIAGYAQDAIASMVKEGIITGSENMLNPKQKATRAETAVIIYKLYNK